MDVCDARLGVEIERVDDGRPLGPELVGKRHAGRAEAVVGRLDAREYQVGVFLFGNGRKQARFRRGIEHRVVVEGVVPDTNRAIGTLRQCLSDRLLGVTGADRHRHDLDVVEGFGELDGFLDGVLVPLVEVGRDVPIVDVESVDLELVVDCGHLLYRDKDFHTTQWGRPPDKRFRTTGHATRVFSEGRHSPRCSPGVRDGLSSRCP